MKQFGFTDEETSMSSCMCKNAPAPYNITKKDILKSVVEKVGDPIYEQHEGITLVEYDLTPYGIESEG